MVIPVTLLNSLLINLSNPNATSGQRAAFLAYIGGQPFAATYPEDFGPWNGSDDSVILAAWVNAINTLGGYYALTPGRTYIATTCLAITGSNYWIEGNGATIQMRSGTACNNFIYALMRMTGNKWKISNLITDGNRATRAPSTIAPTHNFNVIGSRDFIVENVRNINSVFDGSYLDTPTPSDATAYPIRGVYTNVSSDYSYRNGHSHICGYDIQYQNCNWANSSGTAPQGGFDLEADSGHVAPASRDVSILGGSASGNLGVQWSFSNERGPVGISAFGVGVDGTGAGNNAKGMFIAAPVKVRAADIRNFSGATTVPVLDFDNSTVADFEGSVSNITARTGNCLESNGLSGSVRLTASSVTCAGLVTGSSSDGLSVTVNAIACGNNTGASNLVTLGANSSCVGYFKDCLGNMGVSGSGNNDWDIEVDGYGLGASGQNKLIEPATGDRITRLIARNPSSTTSVFGIGFGTPDYLGQINVDLPAGQVYAFTDSPVRSISGASTLGKLTTSLYTTAGAYSVALAATSTMASGSSQQLVVSNDSGGTITFTAASGDSIVGTATVSVSTRAIFECNADTKVWTRIV